jgi:hypothetical protein
MKNLFFAAVGLLGFYVVFKPCLRYWHYKQPHDRPVFLRHTEGARTIDLGMWIVLIAGGSLFLNSCPWGWGVGAGVVLGVLVFDFVMRAALLELEIRRLRKRSPRHSYAEAKEHIRHRVRSLLSP